MQRCDVSGRIVLHNFGRELHHSHIIIYDFVIYDFVILQMTRCYPYFG